MTCIGRPASIISAPAWMRRASWLPSAITWSPSGRRQVQRQRDVQSPTEFPARFVPNLELAMSTMPFRSRPGRCGRPAATAWRMRFRAFWTKLPTPRSATRWNSNSKSSASRVPYLRRQDPVVRMPPYDTGRMRGVIEAVREKSGWEKSGLHALARQGSGTPAGRAAHGHGFRLLLLPPGLFRGSCEGDAWTSRARSGGQGLGGADVGSQIINPSGALNQVQGGVLDGLGQALGLAIEYRGWAGDGHQFPRIPAAAHVPGATGGGAFPAARQSADRLGEPALPPVLPALANAVFAATGRRVRKLPIKAAELKTA
jgi:isoquinoline 1-oxidoreductase beta subunit